MRSHEIAVEDWRVIELASKDVFQDEVEPGWPYKLSEPLFTFWAVYQAQGIIDNGGFQYFFENDWPEKPNYSVFVNAYRRIGAKEAADWIEEAVEMFPGTNPHLDYQMRRDYLDSLRAKANGEDSYIDKLGDRVMDLGGNTFGRLARYVSVHIESFSTAKSRS